MDPNLAQHRILERPHQLHHAAHLLTCQPSLPFPARCAQSSFRLQRRDHVAFFLRIRQIFERNVDFSAVRIAIEARTTACDEFEPLQLHQERDGIVIIAAVATAAGGIGSGLAVIAASSAVTVTFTGERTGKAYFERTGCPRAEHVVLSESGDEVSGGGEDGGDGSGGGGGSLGALCGDFASIVLQQRLSGCDSGFRGE